MNTTIEEKFAPLRKGLLEFVTLSVISANKVYAADILARLSETEFATQEGTLYPLLSKLRREALVDYEWIESESGPPRKYYSLTQKGRTQLEELKDYWHTMGGTIKNLAK
jgi:PadR family transcriptional regulator PadR